MDAVEKTDLSTGKVETVQSLKAQLRSKVYLLLKKAGAQEYSRN